MTERFEVPEPMCRVYLTGQDEEEPRRVAVPVEDVPRIVERELAAYQHRLISTLDGAGSLTGFQLMDRFKEWCKSRFGEAAPEECIICEGKGWVEGTSMRVKCVCTPSATAELIDATPQPTRLDRKVERMERFLTALAKRYTTRDNHTRTLAAAREYLAP